MAKRRHLHAETRRQIKMSDEEVRGSLLPKITVKTGYKDPFRFNHPDQFKALMMESLAHNASDIFVQPLGADLWAD
jgi:hypothetical protein